MSLLAGFRLIGATALGDHLTGIWPSPAGRTRPSERIAVDQPWRIQMFGGLRAERGERAITRFRTQKMGGLLAYLAFHRHRSHPREVLIEAIWPGIDPAAGRLNLRVALHSLRRHLEPPGISGGSVLRADRASVQLNPDVVATDVAEFEAALKSAGRARTATEEISLLETAIDLYRGELLPGYYQDWILTEQRRLADLYFDSVRRLATHHGEMRQWNVALELARRAVALDPLREEAHQDLMRLMAAAGQPAAALQQYRELKRILSEELETEPLASTDVLVREIQKSQETASPVVPVPDAVHPDESPRVGRPTGTVTFLLVEPAVRQSIDDERKASTGSVFHDGKDPLRKLLRSHCGRALRESADSLTIAFERAGSAIHCAVAMQQKTATCRQDRRAGDFPIRMALDTCDTRPDESGPRGGLVRRAAALVLAAHGGQILCSETTAVLARPSLQPDVRLDDLGYFRLRGMQDADRIFSVEYPGMPRACPPLVAAPACTSNLPPSLTTFFGRDEELVRLQEILSGEKVRLLTLSGPGGCGKTRLAVEAARALLDSWRGAVWFVPLDDFNDPALIPDAILDAMEKPRQPRRERLDQVVEALSQQPSLLILDNLENLVEEGAPAVRMLLERVRALTCLVSSRRRLNLSGEREFTVRPLPTPTVGDSPEALMRCPSVQLFVDRAQAARPDFQVTDRNAHSVTDLCRRLEGIPLALELAAARASAITPAQMLAELEHRFDFLTSRKRDAHGRHQTMRAALEWSDRLLSRELRRFFARLSVFRGGWTPRAAEAVCGQPDALSLLEELREFSLVQAEDIVSVEGRFRFRMLETLREYASGNLDLQERETLGQRHADYFLNLAEKDGAGVLGTEQTEWLACLRYEQENLRAALEFFAASGRGIEPGLRLGAALWPFWESRGSVSEGRSILVALLEREEAHAFPATRAEALNAAGILAADQGDYPAALTHFEESLSIHRELENRQGVACVLSNLGLVLKDQGDFDRARSLFEESLEVQRDLGSRAGIAASLGNLGNLAMDRGDPPAALPLFEESLALERELGEKRGIAAALNNLANVHRAKGDHAAARSLFDEALALNRETGNRRWEAVNLHNLGRLAAAEADDAMARACFARSLEIAGDLGDHRAVAATLEHMAVVFPQDAEPALAAQLLGAAAALRETIGAPLPPSERAEYDRIAETVRSALGDEVFDSAWETGRAMASQEAVALALSLESLPSGDPR